MIKYFIHKNIIYAREDSDTKALESAHPHHKVITFTSKEFDQIYDEVRSTIAHLANMYLEKELVYEDRKITVIQVNAIIIASMLQNLSQRDLQKRFPEAAVFVYPHATYTKIKNQVVANLIKIAADDTIVFTHSDFITRVQKMIECYIALQSL